MKKSMLVVLIVLLVGLMLTGCDAKENTYSINGLVVDAEGHGIADVNILLDGEKTTLVQTKTDGGWTANNLAGEYTIKPKKDDWTFKPEMIKVNQLTAKENKAFIAANPRAFTNVILHANIMAQVYPVTVDPLTCSTTTIINTSHQVKVEVDLDETLGAYTADNMIIIEPGQIFRVDYIPSSISYRTSAGVADLEVSFGKNQSFTPGQNDSIFSDMKSLLYRIIAVDHNTGKIYSSSSTKLYTSDNRGETWQLVNTFTSDISCAFVTRTGALLMFLLNKDLMRSVDGGKTFTRILSGFPPRQQDGFAQSRTGAICFVENGKYNDKVRIMRSIDDGVTFRPVLELTNIKHFHSIKIDPFSTFTSQKWMACTGDTDSEVFWYISTDDGRTWTDMQVPHEQAYRTLGWVFTNDGLIWGSDNPSNVAGGNMLYYASRNNLSEKRALFQTVAPLFMPIQLSGGIYMFGTVYEATSSMSRVAELYVSQDGGNTWKTALRWPVKGLVDRGGFSSASLPGPNGEIYINLWNVDGYYEQPYTYGTLRITP